MKLSLLSILIAFLPALGFAADLQVTPTVVQRFSTIDADTGTPDFRQHVVPLLGKLGCNGRACHGSFQGRGGFRLSLFGHDFQSDHDELYGRLDPETPADSLILMKPLTQQDHEGGQRFAENSWQHRLLQNWIEAGGEYKHNGAATLTELVVTPSEIQFSNDGEHRQLQAVAVWSDGTREDVTPLCRFQSNDDQVADVSEDGRVTVGTPGDTHIVAFYDKAVVPVLIVRPVSDQTGDHYPETPTPTAVDELVVSKLKKLGMVQSELCSDGAFLRRVSLDATGTLPTPNELREFLADTSSDKRARKIDELLERPGYAAWWTTKLCDFTGNSDDQLNNVTPIREAATQQWYDWIYKRVEQNVPYDRIVEGIVMAVSRDPGESYSEFCENMSHLYHDDSDASFADREYLPHYWARRNFQQTEDRAIGFAYTFLGTRIQCAQCHKHPFDQWTQDDFKGFQNFFTGVQGRVQNPSPTNRRQYNTMLASLDGLDGLKGGELRRELRNLLNDGATVPFGELYSSPSTRIVVGGSNTNSRKGSKKVATEAVLLGEGEIDLTGYDDIRTPLMDWLTSPDNPLFAKAFVNRVWAGYFNVGIVEPPDDMNLANPPANAALLDYLASSFIEHRFDMKWLHREILNSRTYQLSWRPNATNRLDERNFARCVPRRLPAEVAWDMVIQVVSNNETNTQRVCDLEDRAIALAGAGRRNRNPQDAGYALSIFGRSIRESNCDCDRSAEPSVLQTIFLRNDKQVLDMIDRKDGWLAQVCKENGLDFRPASANAVDHRPRERLRTQLQQQLKRQQIALTRLKQGESDAAVAQKERQIRTLRKRLRILSVESQADTQAADATPKDLNIASIVASAYLRTLCREPSTDELEIARTYIADAESPAEGIRGVLWALVNTKEFIVNH